jgi:hypothetical protein
VYTLDYILKDSKYPSLHTSFRVASFLESSQTCYVNLEIIVIHTQTASVVYWSEFLATDPEVWGLIPGAMRFSEK